MPVSDAIYNLPSLEVAPNYSPMHSIFRLRGLKSYARDLRIKEHEFRRIMDKDMIWVNMSNSVKKRQWLLRLDSTPQRQAPVAHPLKM